MSPIETNSSLSSRLRKVQPSTFDCFLNQVVLVNPEAFQPRIDFRLRDIAPEEIAQLFQEIALCQLVANPHRFRPGAVRPESLREPDFIYFASSIHLGPRPVGHVVQLGNNRAAEQSIRLQLSKQDQEIKQ